MNILVETTPHYSNMGDLAMLQVCLRRLRTLWPESRIFVFTGDPEGLASILPDVEPIVTDGRDLWFENSQRPFTLSREDAVAGSFRRFLKTVDPGEVALIGDFLDVLVHCDLYLFTGMGAFSDAFEEGVMPMLNTIPLANAFGVPVVAFGQGLGPVSNPSPLWEAMQNSFRLLDLIALREQIFGSSILKTMGVLAERIFVTGDDAIELARTEDMPSIGSALGINLRVAPYSGVTTASAQRVSGFIHTWADRRTTEIVSIVISMVPWESDHTIAKDLHPLLNDNGSTGPVLPQDVIAEIQRCRVVVTGSYHGAVFALSCGIPTLCLSQSPYYSCKFRGLTDMFGEGCLVVDMQNSNERAIADTLDDLWENALRYRPSLLQAAQRQVEAGKEVYARLKQFTPSPTNQAWKRGASFPDLLPHWYKRRFSILVVELARTRSDLRKIEDARDWHRHQAEDARKQLAETTAYLQLVEKARDWHRDRADALETQHNPKPTIMTE